MATRGLEPRQPPLDRRVHRLSTPRGVSTHEETCHPGWPAIELKSKSSNIVSLSIINPQSCANRRTKNPTKIFFDWFYSKTDIFYEVCDAISKETIEDMDKDKDGKISLEEYLGMFAYEI